MAELTPFASLLAALPSDFEERHWCREPCVVRGGGRAVLGTVTAAQFDQFESDEPATSARRAQLARLATGRFLAEAQFLTSDLGHLHEEARSAMSWDDLGLVVVRNLAAGCSGAHFDHDENFFVQLEGRKQWRVWAADHVPDDRKWLRVVGGANTSKLAPPSDDPLVNSLVILNAGDLLYLPSFWGHEVSAVSAGLSLSISIRRQLQAGCETESARFTLAPPPPLPPKRRSASPSDGRRRPSRKDIDASALCHELRARARAARPSAVHVLSDADAGRSIATFAGLGIARRALTLSLLGPAATWPSRLAENWISARRGLVSAVDAIVESDGPDLLASRRVVAASRALVRSCAAFDRPGGIGHMHALAAEVIGLAPFRRPIEPIVHGDLACRFPAEDDVAAWVRRAVATAAERLGLTIAQFTATMPEVVATAGRLSALRALAPPRVAVVSVHDDLGLAESLASEHQRLRVQLVALVGPLGRVDADDVHDELEDLAVAVLRSPTSPTTSGTDRLNERLTPLGRLVLHDLRAPVGAESRPTTKTDRR